MKNNHEIILKQYAAYCKEQPLYLGTAGSYGMEMLTIIREGVWAEYDILAAFHPPVGAAVQVRVGANNQIGVPIEATAEKGMGEIVFAGYKEGVRQIAVDVLYKVAPSSGASGTEPAEPTPDVVQQILSAANAAEKLAQSVRDDADVGKFTGAKGDKGDIGPTGPKGEQGPKGERGEKGDPGKDAVIDATLSHAGEAADAAEVGKLKEDLSKKITKFYASNQGETHLTDSDDGKIMDMMLYGKSSQDGTPTPDNPVEIKSVVNPTVKVTNEDGLKVQSVALNNITLNAIPVSSGGNVTINGQQYIADYVDVERGKLVKKLKSFTRTDIKQLYTWGVNTNADNITGFFFYMKDNNNNLPKSDNAVMMSTILRYSNNVWGGNEVGCAMNIADNYAMLTVPTYALEDSSSDENACASFMKICENTNAIFIYSMASPVETDLTPEEIEAFKALITNYLVTNISVTSDQLDGYTVFNYPISLANGWNYVKQQLNDSRDYIYDMDLQSAEAYVNSEYAVALTELEV